MISSALRAAGEAGRSLIVAQYLPAYVTLHALPPVDDFETMQRIAISWTSEGRLYGARVVFDWREPPQAQVVGMIFRDAVAQGKWPRGEEEVWVRGYLISGWTVADYEATNLDEMWAKAVCED